MALSDASIKNVKPKDKPYKMADEKGLYLLFRGITKTINDKYGKEKISTVTTKF